MRSKILCTLLSAVVIAYIFSICFFPVNADAIGFENEGAAADTPEISEYAETEYDLRRVYEQRATCDVPGNIEYWVCEENGKLYADSHGTVELRPEDTITSQTGHCLTLVPASEASCELDGNNAYYVCSVCGKLFEDGTGTVEITDPDSVVLPAFGHEWGEWVLTREADINGDGEEQRVCCHDPSHIETRPVPFMSTELITGDVNSDGVLDQRDVVRLMKYLTGADITVAEPALDTNGDGFVDTKDMTHLLKLLAGSED